MTDLLLGALTLEMRPLSTYLLFSIMISCEPSQECISRLFNG